MNRVSLSVRTEVEVSRWDSQIASRGGTLFHTAGWARFAASQGQQPTFFTWQDEGKPIALALATRRPPQSTRAGRLVGRLVFDSPPAAAEGVGIEELKEPLRRWVRGTRAIAEVEFGSFDARRDWGRVAQPKERLEFLVEPAGPDELLKRMRKGARYSIKKAERSGLTATVAEPDHAIEVFPELYARTLRRLEATKGVAPQRLDEAEFSAGLAGMIADERGRLYIASRDGEVISGCFFGLFGDSAYYLYNGGTEEALSVGATPLVLLLAMQDLFGAGYRRVNLGGVSADAEDPSSSDHGLYAFKRGLGSEPRLCRGGRWTVRPVKLMVATSLRRLMGG